MPVEDLSEINRLLETIRRQSMPGTFRKGQGIKGGKYLVIRRDDTVPDWPWFVLGAADKAAPWALRFYAVVCFLFRMDWRYVKDLWVTAGEFSAWRKAHRTGDPDGARHRVDVLHVVERMEKAKGS